MRGVEKSFANIGPEFHKKELKNDRYLKYSTFLAVSLKKK
jgi:hypothetical protein